MSCAARGVGERESVKFSELAGESCVALRVGERESGKFSELAGVSCVARGAGERESVKFSELANGGLRRASARPGHRLPPVQVALSVHYQILGIRNYAKMEIVIIQYWEVVIIQ